MTNVSLRILVAASLCASLYGVALPAVAQKADDKPFRLQTALNLPDWLKVSGTIRPRYESLENQFTAGKTGDDEYFGIQSMLKVELDAGGVFFGGEIVDARKITGDEGGAVPGEIDTFEPSQIYAAWRPKNFLLDDAALDLTVGRFTMDVGSRRFVSRSGFRSILQSFDGARAVWTAGKGAKVTAFYAAPVNRLPTDVQRVLDNDVEINKSANTRFGGVNVEIPTGLDLITEFYDYEFDESDSADFATRDRHITTAGMRVHRTPKAGTWDMDLEYAAQTGTVHATASNADTTNLDHDASYLHAEAGYSLNTAWSPRISLHYDLGTGDKNPTDGSDERFDALFGDRAFEIGPTSIWGFIARSNIESPGVRLDLKPNARNEIMAQVRGVRLESRTDSLGNTGVRDATGLSGKNAGTQYELRLRHQIVPNSLRLTLGAVALDTGDFLRDAPNATRQGDSYYGYTQLEFTF